MVPRAAKRLKMGARWRRAGERRAGPPVRGVTRERICHRTFPQRARGLQMLISRPSERAKEHVGRPACGQVHRSDRYARSCEDATAFAGRDTRVGMPTPRPNPVAAHPLDQTDANFARPDHGLFPESAMPRTHSSCCPHRDRMIPGDNRSAMGLRGRVGTSHASRASAVCRSCSMIISTRRRAARVRLSLAKWGSVRAHRTVGAHWSRRRALRFPSVPNGHPDRVRDG